MPICVPRCPALRLALLVPVLLLPAERANAKIVWAADFEGLTDIHGAGGILNQPDGVIDILDVNFNGDDKIDLWRPGQQGTNEINIVDRTGPFSGSTKVVQLKSTDATNKDLRFRVENVPLGDANPPRAGFSLFAADDEPKTGQDEFDFTRVRISYYQNTLSFAPSNVFGPGMSLRQGVYAGANLLNVGLSTQIGAGDDSAAGALEINRTLNYAYSAGRGPADAVQENANDMFGQVDPIGVILAAPTADKNGDNELNPLPAPFYMQDQNLQSGLPFSPIDSADVVSQWHDFGAYDPDVATSNDTGGWIKVDVMIDGDVDRTEQPNLDNDSPDDELNTVTIHITHLDSGDTVIESHRMYSDDLEIRSTDPFSGLQFRHGFDDSGGETWFDEIKMQALIYGDINGDDVIDDLDIDQLYAGDVGAIASIDMQLNDLNDDSLVSTTPNDGGDMDELVRVILGTEYGDVDLSGTVDEVDRGIVEGNLGQSGLGWAGGDINGDGVTDGLDLAFFSGGGTPGDYNGSGTVDAADYAVWLESLGHSIASGTGADGDGDGIVGLGDYEFWKSRLGNSAGSGSAVGNVPEPTGTTIFIVLGSALLLSGIRWKKILRRMPGDPKEVALRRA